MSSIKKWIPLLIAALLVGGVALADHIITLTDGQQNLPGWKVWTDDGGFRKGIQVNGLAELDGGANINGLLKVSADGQIAGSRICTAGNGICLTAAGGVIADAPLTGNGTSASHLGFDFSGNYTWTGDAGFADNVQVGGDLVATNLTATSIHANAGTGSGAFDAPNGLYSADTATSIGFFASNGATLASSGMADTTAQGIYPNSYAQLFYSSTSSQWSTINKGTTTVGVLCTSINDACGAEAIDGGYVNMTSYQRPDGYKDWLNDAGFEHNIQVLGSVDSPLFYDSNIGSSYGLEWLGGGTPQAYFQNAVIRTNAASGFWIGGVNVSLSTSGLGCPSGSVCNIEQGSATDAVISSVDTGAGAKTWTLGATTAEASVDVTARIFGVCDGIGGTEVCKVEVKKNLVNIDVDAGVVGSLLVGGNLIGTGLTHLRYFRNNSSPQTLSDGSPATIIFNGQDYQTGDGTYDDSTGIFTATTAGVYTISSSVFLEGINSLLQGKNFQIYVLRNGPAVGPLGGLWLEQSATSGASVAMWSQLSTSISMAVNDTIQINALQNSGGSADTSHSAQAANLNWFTIDRLP